MEQPKKKGKNTNTGKRGRKAKKGMIETEPTIGTRDFYPNDMKLQNWLFDHWKEVAKQFAFQAYDCPILEGEELYKRKAGEEITQQMYNFEAKDKTNLALRPEMTPSLARLILKAGRRLLMPIRWYSIPQCWRYETTTRGRKREHYQWNMDIFGVKAVTAEVELIAAIVSFFRRVGLTADDVGIKINSRRVLQEVLEPLGVVGDLFAPVCVIVDKLDKLEEEEVIKQLSELGLGQDVIKAIQSTLSVKSLSDLKEVLGEDSDVIKEFELLWELAKEYEFDDWLIFDASVVRGLAYYTGVVFECFDRKGELRAICGGGRYDHLLSTYGGQDIPAVGFGFGDCVIVELLKDKGLIPDLPPSVDDIVVCFNESMRGKACRVAVKLRARGRSVDMQLIPKKKVSWCFNYADRIGASRVILVAPDEWDKGMVHIKDLRESEEEKKEYDVKFDEL